jgi:hypothetical protein
MPVRRPRLLLARSSGARAPRTRTSTWSWSIHTCPAAYRESFRAGGFPVEAFVHDPETLRYYFFDVDRASGVPALPQMVAEGVAIPGQSDASDAFKALAREVIAMGPPPLAPKDRDRMRYELSDIVDDIREPRNRAELVATSARLYEILANYYLRSRGLWSARGKSIPRVLQQADPAVAGEYCRSFDRLFESGDASAVIALAEAMMAPDGGPMFEGFRSEAQPTWRRNV